MNDLFNHGTVPIKRRATVEFVFKREKMSVITRTIFKTVYLDELSIISKI